MLNDPPIHGFIFKSLMSADLRYSPHSGIEMKMIELASELLWPILSNEEKTEKRKENSIRVGAILKREIRAINKEMDRLDTRCLISLMGRWFFCRMRIDPFFH